MKFSDEEIIDALLTTGSERAAADLLGCSRSSIQTRKKNPTFKIRFEKARGEIVNSAVDQMRANLSTAVSTLAEIMRDSEVAPSIRVQSADLILRHFLRYFETSELLKRVEKLEEISRMEK